MLSRAMFEWETEDGVTRHYRVGVEARVSECFQVDKVPKPCLNDDDPDFQKSSLLHNVLGTTLFKYVADTFTEKSVVKESTEQENCHLHLQLVYEKDLNDRFVFSLLGVILTLIFSVAVLLCICKFIYRRVYLRNQKHISSENISIPNFNKAETDEVLENSISNEKPYAVQNSKLPEIYSGIPLSYQLRSSTHDEPYIETKVSGTAEFLQNTTDKLYAELDRLLLKNVNDRSTAQLTLSTPRLARRADRRGRIGSSPTLSLTDHMSSTDEQNVDSKEKIEAWNTLKSFSREMEWCAPYYASVDESKLDRVSQRLLHYFHRVSPINSDQWEASVLISNFVILLFKKELKGLCSNIGYKCVQFISTGSAKLGQKVCKSNQFDIFMEVQPHNNIVPTSVIEQTKTECIPPGRLLLCSKINKSTASINCTVISKTGKKLEIEGCGSQFCLSSKEMFRSAEELVELCIQSLYSKHRSLIDRLPFQVKRAVVPNLVVSLDTKNLVGIGMPEIKINIIPVITLPFDGWYQPVKIYAMPLLEVHEYKHRQDTSSIISPDYIWQVAFGDVNEIVQRCINDKMKYAGIDSCHKMCLMILKSLLSSGVKSSLLDRGEYQTLHISTVLNFLLLESQPEQWRFNQLANRFSDCVHFLRDSFTNGRLPNFFINNPHIIEKMPFIKSIPLLMRKRQENLLCEMRTEALEKCVRFLEESLRDSGLAECVKADYSEDMWEYEFFVYN